MIRASLLGLSLILLVSCSSRVPSPPPITGPTVTIDPRHSLGPINRLVFGHNLEGGNSKGIFRLDDSNHPRAGNGAWDVVNRQPIADTVAWSKAIGVGMLRYPGGCLTHSFDWQQAVGPLSERTYFSFGIDEYLTFCRAVGAEPLMGVSERSTPADAAALVEYLNAPADAAHPWAQKRAAWGHPEPWRVRWFEMANESDHGHYGAKGLTATEYAEWVASCSAAMRAVDPSIRIGAHVGTGTPVSDPWNRIVLERLKTGIDFVAIHTYAVGPPLPTTSPELVGRACMAAAEQIGTLLGDYRALIRACTGADIPLAISEYNAGFFNADTSWRFSFAAGLHSADQLRLMLDPRANVVMANYWQYLNGYWGFLRGPEIPDADVRWKTSAAAPLYRLWGEHIGATQIAATVSGVERLEFEGFNRVYPAHGDRVIAPVEADVQPLVFVASEAVEPGPPGSAIVTVRDLTGRQYLDQSSFPIRAGWTYQLTWEQRLDPITPGFTPGLGLCDARGWSATKSACGSANGEPLDGGWVRCQTRMRALSDASALMGVLRLEGSDQPADARVEIRKATVTAFTPATHPAFATLTTHASLSADGRTLHLVVFNKHHEQATRVTVAVADGSARSARVWCVSGPFAATNLEREEVRESLGGAAVPDVTATGFDWTFPPRSMTAFSITR